MPVFQRYTESPFAFDLYIGKSEGGRAFVVEDDYAAVILCPLQDNKENGYSRSCPLIADRPFAGLFLTVDFLLLSNTFNA